MKQSQTGMPASPKIAEKKDLESIGKTLGELNLKLQTSKEELREFKDYVSEYLNNLATVYEGKGAGRSR